MVSPIQHACAAFVHSALQADPRLLLRAILLTEGYDIKSFPAEEKLISSLFHHSIRWDEITVLGLAPHTAPDLGLSVVFRSPHELCHPLNVALMFARHVKDLATAEACVAEYHSIINCHSKRYAQPFGPSRYAASAFNDGGGHRFWSDRLLISPDPAKDGLTMKIKPDMGFDFISLLGWFSDQGKEQLLTAGGDPVTLSRAAKLLGVDMKREIARIANAGLRERWRAQRQPNYVYLADLLRLASRSVAEHILDKETGTRSVLGICRIDARQKHMMEGLSQLVNSPTELHKLYGRAPTVEELTGLRTKNLTRLLYLMPYQLLETVLNEEDAEVRLRARLLRELGEADPAEMRAALDRHPARVELRPYPYIDPSPDLPAQLHTKLTTRSWDTVFSAMARRYQGSLNMRKELQALVPDPSVRCCIALLVLQQKPNPHLEPMLANLPNWAEIAALLQRTPRPIADAGEWLRD